MYVDVCEDVCDVDVCGCDVDYVGDKVLVSMGTIGRPGYVIRVFESSRGCVV